MAPVTGSLAELRRVLSGHNLRLLLGVRLAGQTGDGMLQAGLAAYVLFSPEREATPSRIATSFAVLLLPYSLIGPFVGVLLDRWPRRTMMMVVNVLRAIVVAGLLTILVGTGRVDWQLAIAVLAVLGMNRFLLAGLSASLPHTVDGAGLVTANSYVPTSGTLAVVVGGGLGVVLARLAGGGDRGSQAALVTAAALYLLAAWFATRFPPDLLGPHGERPATGSLPEVVTGMWDGVSVLRRARESSRAIALVIAHRVVFAALTVDIILVLRTVLHLRNQAAAALSDLAFVTVAAGIGAFIAAVLTPWMARRIGPVVWSISPMLLGALVIPIAFSIETLPSLIVLGFTVGAAGQAAKVCADTIVQAQISDDHLGRAFSVYDIVLNGGVIAGATIVALAAPPHGGPAGAAPWASLLLVAASLVYLVSSRPIRLGGWPTTDAAHLN